MIPTATSDSTVSSTVSASEGEASVACDEQQQEESLSPSPSKESSLSADLVPDVDPFQYDDIEEEKLKSPKNPKSKSGSKSPKPFKSNRTRSKSPKPKLTNSSLGEDGSKSPKLKSKSCTREDGSKSPKPRSKKSVRERPATTKPSKTPNKSKSTKEGSGCTTTSSKKSDSSGKKKSSPKKKSKSFAALSPPSPLLLSPPTPPKTSKKKEKKDGGDKKLSSKKTGILNNGTKKKKSSSRRSKSPKKIKSLNESGRMMTKTEDFQEQTSPAMNSQNSPLPLSPQKSRSLPQQVSPSPNKCDAPSKRIIDLTPLVSKDTRWSAAKDAAITGQYTRLKEHVVEAVSIPKEEVQDLHILKSGLQTNTARSSMFQIINEAAAIGSIKTSKHHVVVTNDDEINLVEDNEEDNENSLEYQLLSASSTKKNRLSASSTITTTDEPTKLVDIYVKYQRGQKQKQLVDAEHALERMEQNSELDKKWKSLDLMLPTSEVPKFHKPVSYMTDGRLRVHVIEKAAEMAHARQARLVFDGKFKVHQSCRCRYCHHPSPFQTQAYAKLRMKQNWGDESLEVEQKAHQQEQEGIDEEGGSPSKRFTTSVPKRQTLGKLLTDTAGLNKDLTDPNLPSHFQNTASAKHHVRAWKSKAAQAKRESLEAAEAAAMGKQQEDKSDVASPPPSSASMKGWDDSFLPSRRGRKNQLDQLSMSVHQPKSKPIWSTKTLKKTTPIKDSKQRQQELNDSRHTPAWSSGKHLLGPTSGVRRGKKRSDSLSMTEHSPFRQHQLHKDDGMDKAGSRGRTSTFDGDLDEEQILYECLERSEGQGEIDAAFGSVAEDIKSSDGAVSVATSSGTSIATSFGGGDSIYETGESDLDSSSSDDDDGFGY